MPYNNETQKKTILSAAKNIAITQGITKINIRSVAQDSGIAIGTVYNYFPSKAHLLIAVIEDFWDGAFAGIDWQSFSNSNFYNNLEKIYSSLYLYLESFKDNWLEHLSLLKTQEKIIGKKKEHEYMDKIRNRITTLMDMDDRLRHYPWTDSFSKEKTSEFIFDNMLTMLRKGEKDISFFIMILEKMLSY
ncbi:TetR/AcrR family transcriptional regulator [Lutispora sp.]|uniref:TetR/AcrR family transcriptional regulator n=1 Tax=Lutispora sp. TaxID=2828727 RepID=UPI000EE5273D|nr:TetR/AcrR family transcriptional regulator [Lutispora sp.]MEA4962937.1 TetR/AcrR family transcriptional regulator [Lutispora sp.]HCJ58509.1 transcriptional regulator [Clostridiaceae bacterium]